VLAQEPRLPIAAREPKRSAATVIRTVRATTVPSLATGRPPAEWCCCWRQVKRGEGVGSWQAGMVGVTDVHSNRVGSGIVRRCPRNVASRGERALSAEVTAGCIGAAAVQRPQDAVARDFRTFLRTRRPSKGREEAPDEGGIEALVEVSGEVTSQSRHSLRLSGFRPHGKLLIPLARRDVRVVEGARSQLL
jgi:hypothetical protein